MATKDGIRECNTQLGYLQPIITVDELKEQWLFGATDNLQDNEGNEISDEALQNFIDNAISMLEHDLDVSITPKRTCEEKDYFANDYWEWGYFQLNNIPVIEVHSVKVEYLRTEDPNTGEILPDTVLDLPKNWFRVREHDGLLRLIPNNKFPANLQIGAGGSFFPELFRRHSHVPQLWSIDYTHGFKAGKVPALFNMAIGLLAAIMALNIAGDLIIGAGIAGSSLSLDGLSQSIQTTSSAENHGYSAKVKEYQGQLFDPKKGGILEKLRKYYQGENLNII